MAESSGFFNSVSGDRKYKAEAFAQYFSTFIGNGVFPNPSTGLQIAAGTGMNVLEHPGTGWINGYVYKNDADLSLVIDTADGVLNRVDIVVLRLDLSTRVITVQVVKGTPASSPTAPVIVRTAEQYDLKLAEIDIPAGATAVSQSNITDTRLQTDVCGIVTGVVQQVDTSTFAAQLDNFFQLYRQQVTDAYAAYLAQLSGDETNAQTAYNNFVTQITSYETQAKSDFQTWFDGIKGILGTDEAGNLQNEITALTTRVTTLETKLASDMLFSAAAWLGNSYAGSAYLSATVS